MSQPQPNTSTAIVPAPHYGQSETEVALEIVASLVMAQQFQSEYFKQQREADEMEQE